MSREENPLPNRAEFGDRVGEATCRRLHHGCSHDECLTEAFREVADAAERGDQPAAPADFEAALTLLDHKRRELDGLERVLIERRLDTGGTWAEIARARQLSSPDAARRRYRRLGGERTWPAGRPKQATSTPRERTEPAEPGDPTRADIAALAAQLRTLDIKDDGAALLDEEHLARADLLTLAAELKLTGLERLTRDELRRRVLRQAIGDRPRLSRTLQQQRDSMPSK